MLRMIIKLGTNLILPRTWYSLGMWRGRVGGGGGERRERGGEGRERGGEGRGGEGRGRGGREGKG